MAHVIKKLVTFFLSLFLFFLSFSICISSGTKHPSIELKKKSPLDSSILSVREKLPLLYGREFKDAFNKLISLHKKRVKLDTTDKSAKWSFIEDDLKWGNGSYAIFLLKEMKTNQALLQLIDLNLDLKRTGKTIRLKRLTFNPFLVLADMMSGRNKYTFKKENATPLISSINRPGLTENEKRILAGMESKLRPAGPVKKPAPPAFVPSERGKENMRTARPAAVLSEKKTLPEPARLTPAVKPIDTHSKKISIEEFVSQNQKQKVSKKPEEKPIVIPSEKKAATDEIKTEIEPSAEVVKEPIRQSEEKYYWEIVKVIKNVRVRRADEEGWSVMAPGDKIFEGDTLKTGSKSSVTILIRGLDNKDSYSQLFENSELKVIRLSKKNIMELPEVYMDLILGEVFVNVEGLPAHSSFKVKTPTLVAGIRGTTFSVKTLSDKIAQILVFKGIVGVTQQTLTGFIELNIKTGEELLNDLSGKKKNSLKKIDEATLLEYQMKAQEIAQIIIDSLSGGEKYLGDQKSDEDGKKTGPDGPDDGQDGLGKEQWKTQGPLVDPETGQLFNPDGTPVLDMKGNPVYYGPNGPVDANGNPVYLPPPLKVDPNTGQMYNPDGSPVITPDGRLVYMGDNGQMVDTNGNPVYLPPPDSTQYMPPPKVDPDTGQLLDPYSGKPILDPNGNPVYYSPNGPVDADGNPVYLPQPENTQRTALPPKVDPETGQLIDPNSGKPILDETGNPVYYSPTGPVDADGNPVYLPQPENTQGTALPPKVDPETGQLIDPNSGKPILDPNGNPVYY
ncbi:MAG: FecR domain-containing protein, partial [Candidatus Aureabacteria bacterium]|nr:FecR domain-containing protein [Candidatus Auribacterota bacterium]